MELELLRKLHRTIARLSLFFFLREGGGGGAARRGAGREFAADVYIEETF